MALRVKIWYTERAAKMIIRSRHQPAEDRRWITFFSPGICFDRWNTSEEERKNTAYLEACARLEMRYGKRQRPARETPEFPVTHADRGTVSDLPFTTRGLIEWLRREHGANFTRAYIDRYFFACDELTSESEK